MGLQKLECPGCGAGLYLDDDKEIMACPYCGAKLEWDNISRSKITVTIRDEAKLRELELEENNRIREEQRAAAWELEKKKAFKKWYLVVVIWVILEIVFLAIFKYAIRLMPNGFYIVLIGILAICPFFLPSFYPYRYDHLDKKLLWIKSSVIMLAAAIAGIIIFA